jgi:hypothetical protein
MFSATQEEKNVLNYYNYARHLALKIAQEEIKYRPQGMISSEIQPYLTDNFGVDSTNTDFIQMVIKYLIFNDEIDTVQISTDSYSFTYHRSTGNNDGTNPTAINTPKPKPKKTNNTPITTTNTKSINNQTSQ